MEKEYWVQYRYKESNIWHTTSVFVKCKHLDEWWLYKDYEGDEDCEEILQVVKL